MSGPLNHPPQKIIQQLLIDLGGLVTDPDDDADWPCYANRMPDSPDNSVAVTDTAGVAQGKEHAEGALFEKYGIQIRMRSDGPVDGYVKGARILQAITPVTLVTVTVADETGTATSDYVIQSINPQGPVIRIGTEQDNSSRYVWTLNVLVSLRLVP